MGRHERTRWADRDQVTAILARPTPPTPDEIAFIKQAFTGCGGLVSSDWHFGQFFTPPVVVAFIHDLLGLRTGHGTVLEPACGGGAFFEGLDASRCTGIELEHTAARVVQLCYPRATITRGCAAEMFPAHLPIALDSHYDHVIGNPPFGQGISYQLDAYGPKLRTYKSEEVFLAIAYRAVRPGGDIALIVPDGVLANQRSLPLRKWLLAHCLVMAVISLPAETFLHAGTSVKTSVLYLKRFPDAPPDRETQRTFMAVVEQVGWDSRRRPTGKCDLPAVLAAWRRFQANPTCLDTPEKTPAAPGPVNTPGPDTSDTEGAIPESEPPPIADPPNPLAPAPALPTRFEQLSLL